MANPFQTLTDLTNKQREIMILFEKLHMVQTEIEQQCGQLKLPGTVELLKVRKELLDAVHNMFILESRKLILDQSNKVSMKDILEHERAQNNPGSQPS